MKAIIIDDNHQAISTLKHDLNVYTPHIDVIGEADSVISGAKLLKNTSCDLLFLDIQMQDGNGFDLLDLISHRQFSVIFITASNTHAIKAFKYAAVDYLLKPIDPEELKAAIQKVNENKHHENTHMQLLQDKLKAKALDKIALHTAEKIHIIAIKDILHCQSDGNYTHFYIHTQKPILVSKTLKEFEDLLQPHGFFRTHQSHLINTAWIKAFHKGEGGYLIMQDNSSIPVSIRKKTELMQLIERLSL